MRNKKQSIRDQAITATGGVLGTAVGTLAGPEVALIGGAIGSVGALLAANFVPEFFQDTVVHRLLNNRKIINLLKEKTDADFKYSCVDSQGTFDNAMESARNTINAANDAEASIGSFESRLATGFRWSLASRRLPADAFTKSVGDLAAHCRANGSIRVACPAICSAPIAVLRDIEKRFSERAGVCFDVRADEINGRDFFTALKTSCEFDFVIGPLEALVLCDPERKLPLRVLGPLFQERQSIFITKKKRVAGLTSGIWVFSRSAADVQYLIGLGVPMNAEKKSILDARQIPALVESIPPGDMVIAWEPLSNVLSRSRDFVEVPGSEFMIHFVLLANKRLVARRRSSTFPIDAFLTVFLMEWRRFQHNHDALANTLRRDHGYMKAFGLGCGHHWTHEV